MKKLIAIILTVVSIVLFLVGIFMLYSAGMKIFATINGDELDVKKIIVPLIISAAFFYTGKKLFINSFYEVIRK